MNGEKSSLVPVPTAQKIRLEIHKSHLVKGSAIAKLLAARVRLDSAPRDLIAPTTVNEMLGLTAKSIQ